MLNNIMRLDKKMDFSLSGMFRHKHGSDFVESVDSLILFGKQNKNIGSFIESLCDIYRKEMQLPYKDQTVKLTEIISMLPKNFKSYQIYDRYIIIMDTTRKVFHIHLPKQTVKKEKINYHPTKKFELRSQHKVNKANTVISETTNVKSQFTRL
jgi:hypothetical protein